jgi:ATP-binding cassette, subfamily B, bacterial PglK
MQQLARQKTLIVIAHRLSTVRDCDRIYLLHDGAIEDQGTFGELQMRSARFRAMAGITDLGPAVD